MTEPLLGQRRDRRYVVDIDATVHLPEGGKLKARTRDVSRNGICLVATEAMPVGALVNIELVLSFGNNSFSEPLSLSARLVWCTNLAGSFQVGAMFEDVTDQQDQFLEMFLHYLDGTLSPRGVGEDEDDPAADPGHPDDDDPMR
jgi:PilZ domain